MVIIANWGRIIWWSPLNFSCHALAVRSCQTSNHLQPQNCDPWPNFRSWCFSNKKYTTNPLWYIYYILYILYIIYILLYIIYMCVCVRVPIYFPIVSHMFRIYFPIFSHSFRICFHSFPIFSQNVANKKTAHLLGSDPRGGTGISARPRAALTWGCEGEAVKDVWCNG